MSLFSMVAFAEVTEQTNYYPITASSAQELDAQLSLNNRNGHHADTRWSLQPRYRFNKGTNGCEVAESIVVLTITYTMPEWLNKQAASVKLQKQWDRWYTNLLTHEKNHGANGRQAYNEVKQGIYLTSPATSCSQLTKEINAMIDSTLFKYSQEDTFYDQRTRHGATEGADIQFSSSQ